MTVIELVSFGYLHGQSPAATITLDLRRHFRDPHVQRGLRCLSARDAPVRAAVMSTPGIKQLVAGTVLHAEACLASPGGGSVPVTIAAGCAGGRHRAATVALALSAVFRGDLTTAAELGVGDLAVPYRKRGLVVTLTHRDIDKPVVER
ncbi:RapZ C-terminal domain-containing protein [Streptomyces sp. XH2]|uniref:RapZ C-terminal domain-containing protein n=1 Tax=Streptomyces sp. XH2 TaxID=3412483 RepID=UPI003C7E3452